MTKVKRKLPPKDYAEFLEYKARKIGKRANEYLRVWSDNCHSKDVKDYRDIGERLLSRETRLLNLAKAVRRKYAEP